MYFGIEFWYDLDMTDNYSNEILGYRVLHPSTDEFLDHDSVAGEFLTDAEPSPIPRGDAFRRLAAYLDSHPSMDHRSFSIEPVYCELTPMETTSRDLAGQLERLCQAHELDLGLTREQMEAGIAVELMMFRRLCLTVTR